MAWWWPAAMERSLGYALLKKKFPLLAYQKQLIMIYRARKLPLATILLAPLWPMRWMPFELPQMPIAELS